MYVILTQINMHIMRRGGEEPEGKWKGSEGLDINSSSQCFSSEVQHLF